MFQTKRFGLVASKQEYMMLCRVMEINMIDVQLMQAFHDHDIETIKKLQSAKLNSDNN